MRVKLPVSTKLAYGFGDFGISISYTIIGLFLLFFLTDAVGLPPALAGAAILVGRLWDAVTDPLCGHISDRTVTRYGRRRPYFLFGAVPYGASFALIWLVPVAVRDAGVVTWAAFACVAFVFLVHMTAVTAIAVPYNSLTAELTADYDERTSLTAYRMAFSIVGGLLAAVIPMWVVGAFGSLSAGFAVMGIIFGGVCALSPLGVFVGCREERRPPDEAPLPVRQGIRITLGNRSFRVALGVYLLTWLAIDILSAIFVYFLKYWLHMEAEAPVVLGVLFGTAVLFLPLWVGVSRRTSKRAAYVVGMSFFAVVLVGVIFLYPGQGVLLYALAFLAGIGLSAAHVLPWSMIPDCVEYDELRTGKRREGAYYGFLTFLQKLASSGAIFVIGAVLGAAGYVPDAVQNEATLWAIRALLGPVPAFLFLMAIVLLAFYPLSRQEHERVRREIAARRAAEGKGAAR